MSQSTTQLSHDARTRRAWLRVACAVGLTAFAGCSFDEDAPTAPPNTCMLPADCAPGLSCQAGVCVMQSTDAPLDVTLEITPKRMPDGSQPFPILFGPISLRDAAGPREFKLKVPTTVRGGVRNGIEQINAQLTFVPTEVPASLAKAVQARSSLTLLRSTFSVQLLADVEYRVTVQPTDARFPPYTTVFTADPTEELDIDYDEMRKASQSFVIRNMPLTASSQTLKVRARSKDGTQILSNTVELESGRALLTFAQELVPEIFRLEIAPDQSNASTQAQATSGDCDADAPQPLVPTFLVERSAFTSVMSTKSPATFDLAVDLPTLPEPIHYEGVVTLCGAPRKGAENLLVSMRSSAIALPGAAPGISASYSVSTTTHTSDGEQSFCTRVIPGEYVVLATPPAAVNCEIFAEKRLVVSNGAEPDLLELRTPAKLNGKILDGDMLPIANATIDAVALGFASTMNLADNDPTVSIYNRSRQTASDARGAFELSVDVGVYDLIVKPPMQSGFAWQVQPGLNVGGSRSPDFTTRVSLGAPALIEGTLSYANRTAKSTLAGAEVHAYMVQDDGQPTARGVEIGHTQADENGHVVLFISPEAQPPF